MLPGEGAGDVIAYAQDIGVVKCLDHSWWVCDAVKAANPSVVTIARTLTTDYGMVDCPQIWNWSDPSAWWNAIKGRLPNNYDMIEVINECGWPPGGPEQFAAWSIEMAKLVQRDTNSIMLAFSFSPGNPDYPSWPALATYLRWAEDNPLPDGRRHGIALHASAYTTWTRADSPWIGNPHVNPDRYYLFVRDVVLANTGLDIHTLHIPVVWTEIGLDDGYASGVIGGPTSYSCAEQADAYQETERQLDGRGLFTYWNVGKISIWHSVHQCLPVIFP